MQRLSNAAGILPRAASGPRRQSAPAGIVIGRMSYAGSDRDGNDPRRVRAPSVMTIISHRRKFIFIRPDKVAGTSVAAALAPLCGGEDVLAHDDLVFRSGVDTDYFHMPPQRNAGPNDAYGFVPQHALPDVIRGKVGDKVWREYFKFTIARNPWDRFVSLYLFRFHVVIPDLERSKTPAAALVKLLRGMRRLAAGEPFAPPPERLLASSLMRLLEAGRRKESVEFALRTGCFAAFLAKAPQFYFCGGREYADYVIRFENLRQDFDEARRLMQLPGRVLPRTKSEARPRAHHYRDYYTDYSRAHVARTCRRIVDAFGYRWDG